MAARFSEIPTLAEKSEYIVSEMAVRRSRFLLRLSFSTCSFDSSILLQASVSLCMNPVGSVHELQRSVRSLQVKFLEEEGSGIFLKQDVK